LTFAEHLTNTLRRGLAKIPVDRRDDVYIITLWLDHADDLRIVIAAMSWNTTARARAG
jgi:hypothetical protein